MKHSKNEFVDNNIKGIKNFLDMLNIDYLNLMDKENFLLHLKSVSLYIKTAQKLVLKTVKINKK